ncbi:MAG: protoglobin domain-containing protein [Cyanobium sp.]|nr:protoglobin domain-containing protein [Cyanobium sp.]
MTASIPRISPQSRYSAQELLNFYNIEDGHLSAISAKAGSLMPEIEAILDRFYAWMARHPDMMAFFRSEAELQHVRQMQTVYWQRLMQAQIDEDYLRDRRRVGEIHAKIRLPVVFYMAGVSMVFEEIAEVNRHLSGTNDYSLAVNQAFANLIHLDAGLICQAFVDKRDELLHEQSQAVMAMSTPVTEIWDGILLLPIVGIVDSRRSEDIMNAVLECIKTSKAKEFILDISGVGVVDTAVANYLISITKATALMGCRSTVSGISPSISKTIIQLGIDIDDVNTTSTMMDALAAAFENRGISIQEGRRPAARR